MVVVAAAVAVDTAAVAGFVVALPLPEPLAAFAFLLSGVFLLLAFCLAGDAFDFAGAFATN